MNIEHRGESHGGRLKQRGTPQAPAGRDWKDCLRWRPNQTISRQISHADRNDDTPPREGTRPTTSPPGPCRPGPLTWRPLCEKCGLAFHDPWPRAFDAAEV